jgi:hypothetical protein
LTSKINFSAKYFPYHQGNHRNLRINGVYYHYKAVPGPFRKAREHFGVVFFQKTMKTTTKMK